MAAPSDPIRQTIDILGRLVAHPTVSQSPNLELIAYAADLLGGEGFRTSLISDPSGTRANLFASIGPDEDGGVVLSGHTDVVPVDGQEWSRDPFRATVDGGRIYGRGTSDMKGFLACVLASAPAYAATDLRRPIHIALTYDEEVGCDGARTMLEDLARTGPRPSAALIGEPTALTVVSAHKGCYEYTTEIRGVERHASLSAAGAGAIHAAARFIAELDRIADDFAAESPIGPFDPPATTINVGRIEGGVARNITAGWASFDWEVRPVRPGDAARVTERMDRFVADHLLPEMRAGFADAEVATTTVGAVAGLAPEEESEALELAQRLTGNREPRAVSFGTEAGLYQEQGISTVVCGPGHIEQAHTPDEFIEIVQLEACLQMLERLPFDLA